MPAPARTARLHETVVRDNITTGQGRGVCMAQTCRLELDRTLVAENRAPDGNHGMRITAAMPPRASAGPPLASVMAAAR